MNAELLVSVIITGFNESAYIGQSIESILQQRYENIEVILSDNCSDDDTFLIMKNYAEKYKDRCRIAVTKTLENVHISGNLAHACSFARGDIIVRQCGDDISHADRVGETVTAFQNNPDVHVLGSLFENIDHMGNPLGAHMDWPTVTSKINNSDRWVQCEKVLLRWWPVTFGCCQAFRRNVIDLFERIPDGLLYDDQIIAFRGYLLGPTLWIQNYLVKYRQHMSNAVNRVSEDRSAQKKSDEWRRKQAAALPKVWANDAKCALSRNLISKIEYARFDRILREADLFLGIQGEWDEYTLFKKLGLVASSLISSRRYPKRFMAEEIWFKWFRNR